MSRSHEQNCPDPKRGLLDPAMELGSYIVKSTLSSRLGAEGLAAAVLSFWSGPIRSMLCASFACLRVREMCVHAVIFRSDGYASLPPSAASTPSAASGGLDLGRNRRLESGLRLWRLWTGLRLWRLWSGLRLWRPWLATSGLALHTFS
jgi:hypothetical protein